MSQNNSITFQTKVLYYFPRYSTKSLSALTDYQPHSGEKLTLR